MFFPLAKMEGLAACLLMDCLHAYLLNQLDLLMFSTWYNSYNILCQNAFHAVIFRDTAFDFDAETIVHCLSLKSIWMLQRSNIL